MKDLNTCIPQNILVPCFWAQFCAQCNSIPNSELSTFTKMQLLRMIKDAVCHEAQMERKRNVSKKIILNTVSM